MSLIEQLGGYEAAKAELNRIKSMHNRGTIGDAMIPTLEDLLLEYRRTHGIFEVGGKYCQALVCHATDQEVAAGMRLPQLEVLRDCDISPNTIILGDK